MPRSAKASVGGICYHCLNRGNAGQQVFLAEGDYQAFIDRIARASEFVPMRLLGFCLMPNHFHLVLWPYGDGDLGRWMQRVMTAQVRAYHAFHETHGHLWGGRFKAFPIQEDDHLLTVLRYVERNPVRAGLVVRAEEWPWSSARGRRTANAPLLLHPCPAETPMDWLGYVNQALPSGTLPVLRQCAIRGGPYGTDTWTAAVCERLDLGHTRRARGRPRKTP